MIINKPINIDENNVSMGNLKIKWEVGKAYRTRDGSRAVFMGENNYSDFVFKSLMQGEFKLMRNGRAYHLSESNIDIVGPWEEAQETAIQVVERKWKEAMAVEKERMKKDKRWEYLDKKLDDLYKIIGRGNPHSTADGDMHDYAGAHLRDINTPDNRRPRVSLRTDAQVAYDRAVLRLRQHKLARWGRAEHVRWEEEL